MAKNGYKVLDSDMHIMEPEDLWLRYIDAEFKDRAPRGVTRWPGDLVIEMEGHRMGDDPEDWGQTRFEQLRKDYEHSIASNWDSASQLQAMDNEGIDVAVMYPSRGLFTLAVDGLDPAFGAAIARAYNDWLYEFCSYSPDRMLGAAMVSPFDVESAVSEARRGVEELGFKAVFMRPNIVNERNWHNPYYDPLWAEIERLNVPLGFHEGTWTAIPQVGDRFETFMMRHTCTHPMEMMLAAVSFIGGGILERFPSLQVGFLEANCSWAPWLVWRLNEHYELSGRFESPELKLEPVDYFKRQCYVSVEADEEPVKFVEESGLADSVVFSTDYPHSDSAYPKSIDTFLEMPLSEESKRKILWDNCARMYGFS